MEVLFTLLAERDERGSVMLTSNLPFSEAQAYCTSRVQLSRLNAAA